MAEGKHQYSYTAEEKLTSIEQAYSRETLARVSKDRGAAKSAV